MKFSATLNTSVQQVSQSPISKSTPSLFCCAIFSKEYLRRQYTHQAFRTNLKYKSSHISVDLLGLYLSQRFLFDFLSNLYNPSQFKFFKFMVFILPENAFTSQNWIQTFLLMPLGKTFPKVISSLAGNKITHSYPGRIFSKIYSFSYFLFLSHLNEIAYTSKAATRNPYQF